MISASQKRRNKTLSLLINICLKEDKKALKLQI